MYYFLFVHEFVHEWFYCIMFRIKSLKLKRNAKQSRLKIPSLLLQQGSTIAKTNTFYGTNDFNPAINNNNKERFHLHHD